MIYWHIVVLQLFPIRTNVKLKIEVKIEIKIKIMY
jgi:hypothetical protein